jgi:hypothetical protein
MKDGRMGESSKTDNKSGGPEEFRPAGGVGDDPLTRNLKKAYAEVVAEPIPEEWLKLLNQLDQKSKDGDDA